MAIVQLDISAKLAEVIMLDKWQEKERQLYKALLIYPYIVEGIEVYSSRCNCIKQGKRRKE